MKKLTKASIEALKNEMPVLVKEELEAVKGGGTVYYSCGWGLIGSDRVDDASLYVMSSGDFVRYAQQSEIDDVKVFGAITLDKAPEHLQSMYVSDIIHGASLANNISEINFFHGSGDIHAFYNNNKRLVLTISYGVSVMGNRDELLEAVSSALERANQRL